MKKLFYSKHNLLPSEFHQVITSSPEIHYEAIPETITDLTSMIKFAKDHQGSLFFPTRSDKPVTLSFMKGYCCPHCGSSYEDKLDLMTCFCLDDLSSFPPFFETLSGASHEQY